MAEATGEIVCGLVVEDDWDIVEYVYKPLSGGYGHSFKQAYPPNINAGWQPLGS